jgi:peptidoglycan/LPS O-acetylase OafA/YrhL
VVVILLAVAVLGAVLLYHFVEEPARVWMRSMVRDVRDPRIEPVHGRLQTIHSPREDRSQVVSARAG